LTFEGGCHGDVLAYWHPPDYAMAQLQDFSIMTGRLWIRPRLQCFIFTSTSLQTVDGVKSNSPMCTKPYLCHLVMLVALCSLTPL